MGQKGNKDLALSQDPLDFLPIPALGAVGKGIGETAGRLQAVVLQRAGATPVEEPKGVTGRSAGGSRVHLSNADPDPSPHAGSAVEPCDLKRFLVELDRPSKSSLELNPAFYSPLEAIVGIRSSAACHGAFDRLPVSFPDVIPENLPQASVRHDDTLSEDDPGLDQKKDFDEPKGSRFSRFL